MFTSQARDPPKYINRYTEFCSCNTLFGFAHQSFDIGFYVSTENTFELFSHVKFRTHVIVKGSSAVPLPRQFGELDEFPRRDSGLCTALCRLVDLPIPVRGAP